MGNYYRGEYHEERPDWRDYRGPGKLIGIELELEHNTGYEELLNALPDPGAQDGDRPITEEDGSLSNSRGVEIVFPPYSYGVAEDPSSFLSRAVNALKQAGASVSSRTGMHMNINVGGWSRRKMARFMGLLHNLPDTTLANIGGRYPNCYCSKQPGTRFYVDADDDTHTVAAYRGSRIEVRFPAATVNIERIAVLSVFLEYVEKWAGSSRSITVQSAFGAAKLADDEWEDSFDDSLILQVEQKALLTFRTFLSAQEQTPRLVRMIEVMEGGM